MQHRPPLEYRTPVPARGLIAVVAAVLGVSYALVIAWMAVGMSGAGHGWNSASITCLGVFVIPSAAVGIVYRRTSGGLAGAIATLLAGVVIDLMLFSATWDEGTEYVARVWNAVPAVVILWLLMWSGWHSRSWR
jgi:hypothetical protein